jgi:AraC-like DNA-binding protein
MDAMTENPASGADDVPLYAFFGRQRLLVFAHEYEAGSLQHRHRHDVPQLVHAARGVMRMTTPQGYWVIPPGRGVWIPAFLPHEIRMVGPVFMRSLYVGCETDPALAAECAVVDVPPLLQQLLEELAGAEPPPPGQRPRRHAMEDLVLIEIARLERLRLHIPLPRDPRLRRLCEEILLSPNDGRTLEDLSDLVGASVRTLRRLFQEELKMSFADWRQQALVVEALARLEEGQSVSAVSRALGYAAPSAFTAMFKRVLGRPPRSHQALYRVGSRNDAA